MKLRDAERCGKASQAMIDRIQVALEKLTAKEEAILKLLETLPTLNEQLETEYEKWNALQEELDPDGELTLGVAQAPSFDVDEIRTVIEGAFFDARAAIETEIGDYEEVVAAADSYVEPEEEEEEAEEISWICSHPGCGASSPEAPTPAQADAAARGGLGSGFRVRLVPEAPGRAGLGHIPSGSAPFRAGRREQSALTNAPLKRAACPPTTRRRWM